MMSKSKMIFLIAYITFYILIVKMILANYFVFYGMLLLVISVAILSVWMFIFWLKDKNKDRWYWLIILFSGVTWIGFNNEAERVLFEPYTFISPSIKISCFKENYYLMISFPIGAILYYILGHKRK